MAETKTSTTHTARSLHQQRPHPAKKKPLPFKDKDISAGWANAEEEAQKLAAIVASSQDAIIGKKLDGTITSWNKGAEKLYGYTAEEIIGKPITILIPPERTNDFPEIMGRLRLGKSTDAYETKRRKKNGEIIDVFVSVSPVRDKKGTIISAASIARDITERKQTEKNYAFLAEASKLLTSSMDYKKTLDMVTKLAVQEVTDWCIMSIVEDGNVNQISIAHKDPEKMYWAHKLQKRYPPDIDNPRGVYQVIRTGKAELMTEIPQMFLEKNIHDKEQRKILDILGLASYIIVPIKIRNNVVGAITFVAAESNRHYTKKDLFIAYELANHAALAIANALHYKQAQEEILFRKREEEKLRKLEKQKDEFIGIASHELKTPVTSIKAYTQVLYGRFTKQNDMKAMVLLMKMDNQLNKLTSLIGDLLDTTKIEGGRLQFTMEYFDFNELVLEIVEEMQRTTEYHKLITKLDVTKIIWGDRDRTGQVLTNLLSNAIKYSPHTSQIIVKTSITDDLITLSVQDFGVGIAKKNLTRIFERFYRATGPKKETFPGMGLGLYVASEIVKRQGGKISAESAIGKGSIFHFSLPLIKKQSGHTSKPVRTHQHIRPMVREEFIHE